MADLKSFAPKGSLSGGECPGVGHKKQSTTGGQEVLDVICLTPKQGGLTKVSLFLPFFLITDFGMVCGFGGQFLNQQKAAQGMLGGNANKGAWNFLGSFF